MRDVPSRTAAERVALGGVTVLVLFLSAIGIFALTSISVSRRTREIGLRTALGARPRAAFLPPYSGTPWCSRVSACR
jgi:ABC-type lipoprotein release transport system permease subunit